MAQSNPHDHGIDADVALVRAITAGSVPAWHTFVDRYSRLVYGVLKRHLFSESDEEIRTVFVDVLELLYGGELANYRGESKLSTWLIVVTRRRAVDFHRRQHGRYRLPKGWSELSDFDRLVLQAVYIDRLPLDVAMELLEWHGHPSRIDDVVRSVQTIEHKLDARYLRRLENEYKARRAGTRSVPLLKFFVEERLQHEEKMRGNGADSRVIERELQKRIDEVRAAVATLSPEEREIIRLRFDDGWTARQIAKATGTRQRRVYTLIDGALTRIRKHLSGRTDV